MQYRKGDAIQAMLNEVNIVNASKQVWSDSNRAWMDGVVED